MASTPRKLAILAPHLLMPVRNGCDIYIAHKYAAVDSGEWTVTLVTADGIYRLHDGRWEPQHACPSTMQSRARIASSMLLGGNDYLSAKFNTVRYLALCGRLRWSDFDRVIASFATSYDVTRRLGIADWRVGIETHNFDPKLYLDRALEQRGLKRLIAVIAAMRAQGVLKGLPAESPVFALGPADRCLFEGSGFTRVIETVLGHDVHPPRVSFPTGPVRRIAFVGALSTEMNVAALRDFIERHWPQLKAATPAPLKLMVAGSKPSADLRRYLKAHGIELLADASQDVLHAAVQRCHATILPFAAANGLKLKFAMSTSLGVPVLGFIDPPDLFASVSGVLHSRNMTEWSAFLTRLVDQPAAQNAAARELQATSALLGWSGIVRRDLQALDRFAPRPTTGPTAAVEAAEATAPFANGVW